MLPIAKPNEMIDLRISNCNTNDLELIRSYVKTFRLDDEGLSPEQFLVAKNREQNLLGFGRLRKHADSLELCTLGVLPQHRKRGIAQSLVTQLLTKATEEVFVVCIIPEFFEKFDFKITNTIPLSIQRKRNVCTTVLAVTEPYFVMKLIK